jgi:hypothetical protein
MLTKAGIAGGDCKTLMVFKQVTELLQVRDLQNQLAEERKTRLKQETRAFAAAHKSRTEKRPPSVWSPLKLRGLKNYRRPSLLPSQPLTEMQ